MIIISKKICKLLKKLDIKIICAFPGVGKHRYIADNPNKAKFIGYLSFYDNDEQNTQEFLNQIYNTLKNENIEIIKNLKYIFLTSGKKMVQIFNKFEIPYSMVIPDNRVKKTYCDTRLKNYSFEIRDQIRSEWKINLRYIEENANGDIYLIEKCSLADIIKAYF